MFLECGRQESPRGSFIFFCYVFTAKVCKTVPETIVTSKIFAIILALEHKTGCYSVYSIFRHDFSEKGRLFKERLNDFRNEVDALKREDRQTEHDVIHAHNIHNGFDKFTTLRMVSKSYLHFDRFLFSLLEISFFYICLELDRTYHD